MGSDFLTALLVQAAVQGVVDFSKANVYDAGWKRQLTWKLRGLQKLNQRERAVVELTSPMLSMLRFYGTTESSEKAADRLLKLYDEFDSSYKLDKWAEKTKEQYDREKVKQGVSSWESVFGAMHDPEVQKKITLLAAALEAQMSQTQSGPVKISETDAGVANRQLQDALSARTKSQGRPRG